MSRASGSKQIKINTRERAVSTDNNRAGAFISSGVAEALRHIFDVSTAEANSGGLENLGSSVTDPLRGVILAGLRGRPEIGTTNLFVEPGVALLTEPTNDVSDDSPLKWIKSVGVVTAGALTLTSGAGSARIDMLECQILLNTQEGTVVETASRDIYNTTTGQFVGSLVNKVNELQLTFRIRTGTPGGGFAGLGTASGWLPLMVWVTPAAAVDWDDVLLIWDVRPLASDHVAGPYKVDQTYLHYPKRCLATLTEDADPRLMGVIDIEHNGRWLGGEIGAGTVEAVGFVLQSAIDAPGITKTNDLISYYFVTPHGLPRWAQYTTVASGSRLPGPMRGILVASNVNPNFDGTPQSAVALPAATDLAGTTTEGRLATCVMSGAAGMVPFTMQDGWVYQQGNTNTNLTLSAGVATGTVEYTVTEDTIVPRPISALEVNFFQTLTAMGVTPDLGLSLVTTWDDGGTGGSHNYQSSTTEIFKNTAATVISSVVPMRTPEPLDNTPNSRIIEIDIRNLTTPTFASQSCNVVAWKLGM